MPRHLLRVDSAGSQDGRNGMLFTRFGRLRSFGIVIVMTIMALTVGLHGAAATQNTPDVTTRFYGYFADSGSSTLLLGQLQSGDPTVAAQLVSPQYADDFFSGFKSFTNYDFAHDLSYTYIDQIDEA